MGVDSAHEIFRQTQGNGAGVVVVIAMQDQLVAACQAFVHDFHKCRLTVEPALAVKVGHHQQGQGNITQPGHRGHEILKQRPGGRRHIVQDQGHSACAGFRQSGPP